MTTRITLLASLIALTACGSSPTAVNQAFNSFQNEGATGGAALTVDAGGPETIVDGVEFPGFAFGTYNVDATNDSITMTFAADIANLQITDYDNTTFDRYYYEFDTEVGSASLDSSTDVAFDATVEILDPGATVMTAGAFVDGLPMEATFTNGAILVTVGEGTDLTAIGADGGLTINF